MKLCKTFLIILAVITLSYASNTEKRDFNILLITVDTLRYDRLGVYSDKYVKTPYIDELSSHSFVFRNAYAHNPVTLPSHVNIMTGVTPVYHGISDNPGFVLDGRFLTIAEYLKEKKYSTGAFIGAFPLDSRFGLNQGFDVYDDNIGTQDILEIYFTERPADKVIEPARQWISEQKNKWFAWIHLFDPHEPYSPLPPFDKEYSHDPYSGEVAYVDSQLGLLFDFMKKHDLMESTIVILTADHGEAFGEKGERSHSYFAYNNTIHIPLIIYVPGAGPKTIDENVCHVDIFPTICQQLGYEIPSHLQGESLIPIIEGEKRKNSEIYFESLTPYLSRGWAPLTGFIRGNMKFINQPIKELYNLKEDRDEDVNLAKKSDMKKWESDLNQLVKKLRGKENIKRFEKIDIGEMNKLKSLGYLLEGPASMKEAFTEENDLKVLKPFQNKMYNAINKYKEGKIEEAVDDLKEVIEQRPDFVLAYKHIASIYYTSGRIDDTIGILRMGLKNNPKNLNLMSKLGIMLVLANKKEEAIELLQKCIKKDKQNPEYFNYLGVAYQKSDNFKLALENYKKAIEIDNNFALPWNNMGSLYLMVYLKTKKEIDFQRAIDNFNTALAFDPGLFAAINGKKAAYKFKEQIEKAIDK